MRSLLGERDATFFSSTSAHGGRTLSQFSNGGGLPHARPRRPVQLDAARRRAGGAHAVHHPLRRLGGLVVVCGVARPPPEGVHRGLRAARVLAPMGDKASHVSDAHDKVRLREFLWNASGKLPAVLEDLRVLLGYDTGAAARLSTPEPARVFEAVKEISREFWSGFRSRGRNFLGRGLLETI